MKTIIFDAKMAREISLEKVLSGMGYAPRKRTDLELWYISPFREEKTPSFKVNLQINKWFDFGEQVGGNTLDFVMHKFGLSVKEALQYLSKFAPFSFQPPETCIKRESSMLILGIRDIIHLGLMDYLDRRGIPTSIYRNYCKQIYYENGRRYFAIGFPNNSGGYELRSKYFKGCIGKKDITTFSIKEAEQLLIFEGFMDYLSYLTLNNDRSISCDSIVLNSLSNIKRIEGLFQDYDLVKLYLDNDEAGNRATERLLCLSENKTCIVDARSEYLDFKDLNDYLLHRLEDER